MNTLEYKDYETTQFSLANNLKEYNQIVRERYAANDAVLEGYNRGSRNYATNEDVTLETYAPVQTYSYDREGVELDSYASRPEPAYRTEQTFRPSIMESEEILGMTSKGLPRVEADYTLLNFNKPVAECVVDEAVENAVEVGSNVEFLTRVKLNAVGMVSVVSFVAVTLLVFSFIILNAVGISAGAARIAALENTVAGQTQVLSGMTAANAAKQAALEEMLTEGYYDANGYEILTPENGGVVTLPKTPAWTPLNSADTSTSFFDMLSRFFSRIFA